MIIERLNPGDRDTAEELWSLQHAAYRVEAAIIGATELPPLKETVADLMNVRETFWGCRTVDGELAGAISAEAAEGGMNGPADRDANVGFSTVVICRLMVHPERFRQGIGFNLLRRAISDYPPDRLWEVTAEVRNLPALALYGKFGFREIERFSPADGIVLARLRRDPSGS